MKTLSIIFIIGAFLLISCNMPKTERTPKKIIYKEKVKRHGDSVWLHVTEYVRDTDYQEVILDRSSATVFPE